MRLRIDKNVTRCNVSVHNPVFEIDIVDELGHLDEPGKAEVSEDVIVFQSPPWNERACPPDQSVVNLVNNKALEWDYRWVTFQSSHNVGIIPHHLELGIMNSNFENSWVVCVIAVDV